MNLKSSPGSICGYSVVDRSVTFARPDLQLTEANIFSALPSLHLEAGSGPSQVTSQWEYCASKRLTLSNLFLKHSFVNLSYRFRKNYRI